MRVPGVARPLAKPGGLQGGVRLAGRGVAGVLTGAVGNLFSVLAMVFSRTRANFRLLLMTIAGLVITVTLVCSVPLYSEGVAEQLLHQALLARTDRAQPPASLLFHWVYDSGTAPGATADPQQVNPLLTIPQYQRINQYLVNQTPSLTTLPLVQPVVRYGSTDKLPVYQIGDKKALNTQQFKDYLAIAFLSELQNHITITEGKFPDRIKEDDGAIEVIATEVGAEKLILNVGDEVTFANRGDYQAAPITVKVVGLWKPKNANDAYWFYRPDTFDDYFLIPEESYFKGVLSANPNAPYEYYWFFIFDQADIHSTNVQTVLDAINELTARSGSILPGTTLDISPGKILDQYLSNAYFLKVLLFALSAPTLAIVLYYITISSAMLIDRQRNEIAVLKSRGAGNLQILGIYLVEGGFIGVLALVVGPLLGDVVAQIIGLTYTFLYFANRDFLPVRIASETYQYAIGAVVLSLLAMLLPAAGAARHTIISYKQEVARSNRKPLWQRFFLDFIFFGVGYYGFYLLKQRGSLLAIDQNGGAVKDPLLLLVPAVWIFSIGLISMRVFPLAVELLSRIGNRVLPLAINLGLKHIARTPVQYTRLVLLLVLTIALGTFSASMAQTLDQNEADHILYANGADLMFAERGDYDEDHQLWTMEPIQRYDGLKGVQAVTRVLNSKAQVLNAQGRSSGDVMLAAIDNNTYPLAGWYRDDLNPFPEKLLMDVLKAQDDAILASYSFTQKNKLSPGDTIQLRVASQTVNFVYRGGIGSFPTVYASDNDFFVANIDYVLGVTGDQPYNVFMKLKPGTRPNSVRDELANLPEFPIYQITDSTAMISAERSLPQNTGLFGTLSVGFLVAALLTVMGFLLYSFLSYQRRLQQLGIMRAIGLSVWGLIALLTFEQLFLIVVGVAGGTVLGRWVGSLFIPFLHIDVDAHANMPPFEVHTPWDQIFKLYLVLGIMLALAMPTLITSLLRMRIHEATKLGEEQG
jgi:putative ABC transport system permease protein